MVDRKEVWKVVKPRRGTRRSGTYPAVTHELLTAEDMRLYTERAKIANTSTKLIITEQNTRSGSFGPHKHVSGRQGPHRRRSRIRRRRSSRKESKESKESKERSSNQKELDHRGSRSPPKDPEYRRRRSRSRRRSRVLRS